MGTEDLHLMTAAVRLHPVVAESLQSKTGKVRLVRDPKDFLLHAVCVTPLHTARVLTLLHFNEIQKGTKFSLPKNLEGVALLSTMTEEDLRKFVAAHIVHPLQLHEIMERFQVEIARKLEAAFGGRTFAARLLLTEVVTWAQI